MKRELFDVLPEFEGRDDFIKKIMKVNGEDIEEAKEKVKSESQSEIDKLSADLEDANSTIGNLKETVKGLEDSSENVEDLKKQIADFEAKEKKAKEERDRKEKEAGLRARFDTVTDGVEFVNDFTKDGAFAEFKKALGLDVNKGKGDKEIYDEILKGNEGWLKQQQQFKDLPGVEKIDPNLLDAEKFKKLSVMQQMEFANEHPKEYEELSKVL